MRALDSREAADVAHIAGGSRAMTKPLDGEDLARGERLRRRAVAAKTSEGRMTPTCIDAKVGLILAEAPHLHVVARRLVRCASDADDLVQDTLFQAYRARDRFESGTSMRAWTTTILRRVFLTGAMRAKRRRLQTDTDAGGLLASLPGRLSSREDDRRHDGKDLGEDLEGGVKQVLDRVPEIYRTAFLLSALHDMTCAEISQHLRLPAGTVMSRIHRARERLKSDLALHRRELGFPFVRSRRREGAA